MPGACLLPFERTHLLPDSSVGVNDTGFPSMGLLPDMQNCGLRMRRECRECVPRHRFQRKLLISDNGMHHGTCVKHVP